MYQRAWTNNIESYVYIDHKCMCTDTMYISIEEKYSVKSTFSSAVHGEFTKSDHMLDQCYWQYKTGTITRNRVEEFRNFFMQFERGVLFLLEIIKSWCFFFLKKMSSTKKCYKHYWELFLRDGFLEVELLGQWHTPFNVNWYCQVVSIYLLPCNTPRVHLSPCSLTTLAMPKAIALLNIFQFSRLKDIFCLWRTAYLYPQPIFY